MISEKVFTLEEFEKAIPEFGQALINRCAEKIPGVKLNVRQEAHNSYLFTLENGHKSERYQLTLCHDGLIESTSVYGV